jgi:hypothetical protein
MTFVFQGCHTCGIMDSLATQMVGFAWIGMLPTRLGESFFPDVRVHHLISSRSDHCPVLVELRRDAWENKGSRTFRYEIMLEHVETLSEEIKKVWCSTTDKENLGGLVYALQNMQKALRQWSKEQFGAVSGELNDLRKHLEEVKSRSVVC